MKAKLEARIRVFNAHHFRMFHSSGVWDVCGPARPCACEEDSNNREGIAHFWRLFLAGCWAVHEKIVGKAFGELDPNDPKKCSHRRSATCRQETPRAKVEYSFDFYILKPADLNKGNHKMLYEPPNRGRKTIGALNRGVGGDDPGSVKDASLLANSFLMPQGYSISSVAGTPRRERVQPVSITTITLPVARNPMALQ